MKKLTIATLLAIAMGGAYANISATPLWITLQPGSQGSNIANITITNPDPTTAYVEATINKVAKINDPNSPTTTFQPGDNPQEFGLLVSPAKFAIKPDSSLNVRVSNLNMNPTTDTLYTVVFTPISNPQAETNTTGQNNVGLKMNMILSYKAQIYVIPENIQMKVCPQVNGNNITINNQGNSFIQLVSGKLCSDAAGDKCSEFSKYDYTVIPAGQSFTLPKPSTGVVNYTVKYGKGQTVSVSSATPC